MTDPEPTDMVEAAPPALRVLDAHATPEEIATIVAVFSSLGGSAAEPLPVSEWSAHHRKVRAAHPHGPGGWRSSGLPR